VVDTDSTDKSNYVHKSGTCDMWDSDTAEIEEYARVVVHRLVLQEPCRQRVRYSFIHLLSIHCS
jgi:hypothetical protein